MRWLALIWLIACESLGNPPLDRTAAERWQGPGLSLVTTSRSVSASRSSHILDEPGVLHAVERNAPSNGAFIRVEVVPQWQSTPPALIELETTIELRSGERVIKHWSAPGDSQRYVAIFGARSKAQTARTRRM